MLNNKLRNFLQCVNVVYIRSLLAYHFYDVFGKEKMSKKYVSFLAFQVTTFSYYLTQTHTLSKTHSPTPSNSSMNNSAKPAYVMISFEKEKEIFNNVT